MSPYPNFSLLYEYIGLSNKLREILEYQNHIFLFVVMKKITSAGSLIESLCYIDVHTICIYE